MVEKIWTQLWAEVKSLAAVLEYIREIKARYSGQEEVKEDKEITDE